MVIENARHMVTIDQPVTLNAAVGEFLASATDSHSKLGSTMNSLCFKQS